MTNPDKAIQEKVRNILVERCQIVVDSLDSDQTIHLDSMALMELIIGLENVFNIKLDDDKLEDFYRSLSLNHIVQLVAEKTKTFKSAKG